MVDEEQPSQEQPMPHNLMKPKVCTEWNKLCYGLGHVHNDLCSAVWFSYTLFYWQIVMNMDSISAGILMMSGQVADSLATPAAGWVVDRTGARRAWHIAGTLAVASGFLLTYAINPSSIGMAHIVYFHITTIVFQIGWAVVQISHLSVLPIISTGNSCSTELTAIRYTASVCSNIFVYLLTWLILSFVGNESNELGPNDFYKFRIITVIITVLGFACNSVFYYGVNLKDETYDNIIANEIATQPVEPQVRPRDETSDELQAVEAEEGRGYMIFTKDFYRLVLKYLTVYLVSVMYMCARLFASLYLVYIPLYLHENEIYLGSKHDSLRSAIALVPMVLFIASLLTSLCLKFLNDRINGNIIYIFGAVLSIVSCIWISVASTGYFFTQICFIVILIGIGNTFAMVASLSMAAEFVKQHGFQSATVYSIITFTDKLFSGLVVFLIQHVQCDVPNRCNSFYRRVLGYVCGATAFFGITALILLHFLNRYLTTHS